MRDSLRTFRRWCWYRLSHEMKGQSSPDGKVRLTGKEIRDFACIVMADRRREPFAPDPMRGRSL